MAMEVVRAILAKCGLVGRMTKQIVRRLITSATIWVCWTLAVTAIPDGRAIDRDHSSLRVHVYKAGFLSAFAHDHEVEAPIESGEVTETGSSFVELRVDARKIRVLDPEVSDGTRAQIQTTMQGPQVLDADRYSEIHFRSTGIEPKGADHWVVNGTLDLHGQTHPVTVEVTRKDGLYKGSATLKQTTFGITPVAIAGGTVRVKDDIKIEFEIALAR